MDKMNLVQIFELLFYGKITVRQYDDMLRKRTKNFQKPDFQHSKN